MKKSYSFKVERERDTGRVEAGKTKANDEEDGARGESHSRDTASGRRGRSKTTWR